MVYELTTKEPKAWILEALSEKRLYTIMQWHKEQEQEQNKICNGGK